MHRKILIILSFFGIIGCEKMLMSPQPEADPESIFQLMWETLDEKYSFFELKNIDWDLVADTFSTKIRPEMSDQQLFDVLAEMLYVLRDGHTNLVSEFDLSRNWRWYLDHPDNFDADLVMRNYLQENARISGALRHQVIDSVLYVQYGSFASPISGANLNVVLQRADSCKGVIIDVRHNGGGSLGNALFLASAFIKETQNVYSVQERKGPGRNDFSALQSVQLSPHPRAFTGPVVVLINRRSYSASTYFATMMKYNEHIKLMGDSTGGGGGTPIDAELPNGWRYRFSTTRTFDRRGFSLEPGVAPDIEVHMTEASRLQGIDDIIEAALAHIKGL